MSLDPADSAATRLRELETVTDARLGRLDVDDLLFELLSRVRTILDADTAAVLMLDVATQDLVPRAACGLEEEVHQGVRIPVGDGFAGRVAQLKRPVTIDRVDPSTVVNPILWDKGLRVMLGVPLLAQERLIGVLHVGRLIDRPFQSPDIELLEIVAERVAGALEIHQSAIEQAAAELLERSLLPGASPVCPGLEFATRYITPDARAVGGDWYDLFTLPSGDLWVVVGDVAGHGLPAAVVMGRIRSALRAYALLGGTPEKVLELTDRKVTHFEIDAMATVICATSSPPFEHLRVASAGHPPPIVARAGEPSVLVDVAVGPPLGAAGAIIRSATDISLKTDTTALFYTDGLIERRGEHLDIGFERLRRSTRSGHPDAVCRDILRELVGSLSPTDDIAMVAMRKAGPSASPE